MSRVDLKIVLLGNATVGKTSLMERYVHDSFNGNRPYQNTIGTVFAAKKVERDGVSVVLGIWDTAGSEKYDSMTRTYYRGAKAAIVCYDITKFGTFQRARHWMIELRNIEENCKIYLCGTKKDLCNEGFALNDTNINAIENFVKGTQTKLFMTSSKTGENVDELFDEIIKDFVSNPENLRQPEEETIVLSGKSEKGYCCALI